MAALPLALASCQDDNDLPDVDFTLAVDGAVNADGMLYVVRGETLAIKSITVTNKESGKAAMISSASYYWDGYYLGVSVQPPYGFEIETTDGTVPGRHTLEIVSPLFAVDKTLATAVLVYDVKVVPTAEDIPAGGSAIFTVTPSVSESYD